LEIGIIVWCNLSKIVMRRFSLSLLLAGLAVGRLLGSEPTNAPSGPATPQPLGPAEQAKALARAQLAEKVRAECIEARRYVAGRVIEITANGLIVESGYSALLQPPFNQSWVVRGNATVAKDLDTPEEKHPDAVCRGLVLLTSTPRRPKVKPYDYVVIHAYPAGEDLYRPVPGVEKTIRRYSASLETAVQSEVERREK
jgi:hypothetical protein